MKMWHTRRGVEAIPLLPALLREETIMLLPEQGSGIPGDEMLFDRLVSIGETEAPVTLPHQLHTFLVHCLIEYVRDVDVTHQVLATTLLAGPRLSGAEGNVRLKRLGDGALLLAGLFPERAMHLNVSSQYFRMMGQSAYATLGARLFAMGKPEQARCYGAVARSFDVLTKVLDAGHARPDTEWGAYRRFRVGLM